MNILHRSLKLYSMSHRRRVLRIRARPPGHQNDEERKSHRILVFSGPNQKKGDIDQVNSLERKA